MLLKGRIAAEILVAGSTKFGCRSSYDVRITTHFWYVLPTTDAPGWALIRASNPYPVMTVTLDGVAEIEALFGVEARFAVELSPNAREQPTVA